MNADKHRLELRQAKNISIGIFEPCYFRAAWCGPDTLLVLIWKSVVLELHAGFLDFVHFRCDVRHLPAQHGVLGHACVFHPFGLGAEGLAGRDKILWLARRRLSR
jgi:hypothetical protein